MRKQWRLTIQYKLTEWGLGTSVAEILKELPSANQRGCTKTRSRASLGPLGRKKKELLPHDR